MFAGGADATARASFGPERADGGGGFGSGSSLKKSAELRAGASSGGSLGAWSHGSANSLGSRGSSVRGGNAFGPGSALGASIGNANLPNANLPAPVSPVGSFDGGGVWARSPALDKATVPGAAASEAFVRPADPADRAATPGISAEAARDILDRLETPDLEQARDPAPEDTEETEARRTLLVRGAPGASPNAAELYLYRAFAPHGAIVSVRSTGTPGVAEHVVTFRRAPEADAARRALDGGALGALRVTALDADGAEGARRE